MSTALTISDAIYARLEQAVRRRGLSTIEQLLEAWQAQEEELQQRRRIVQQIDQVRERLFAIYGEMPDSVSVLREDRAR